MSNSNQRRIGVTPPVRSGTPNAEVGASVAAGEPIPLVSNLVAALSDAGVDFCHWKSNAHLNGAIRGETDLDLLVARDQSREFAEVLNRCGFISAVRSKAPEIPGINDFFGYDQSVDRFVHVHAHYQLVLGHDRTKNYRLPIERAYLSSATSGAAIPIPSPEFEYLVLVIRMILKYAIWDEILWNGLRGRSAQPKPSEAEELDQLSSQIDREVVLSLVEDQLPYVGRELFAAAENVVTGSSSVWRRVGVSRRLQRALRAEARRTSWMNTGLRIQRRLVVAGRRRLGVGSKYKLATGGAMIALIGGDGAGKTTALEEVGRWLGGEFDVSEVHLGKPPWSLTTYVVRGSLKVAHSIGELVGRSGGRERSEPAGASQAVETRRLVWLVCIARDRHLTYRRARRAANRGSIVLSDRFPHPALQLMDVPQIERLTNAQTRSSFIQRMVRLENHYHSLLALPEVVVVLRVEPGEAASRKTTEPEDYVIERSTEIWEIDWGRHDVQVVDANRPASEVATDLKSLIWASLS